MNIQIAKNKVNIELQLYINLHKIYALNIYSYLAEKLSKYKSLCDQQMIGSMCTKLLVHLLNV